MEYLQYSRLTPDSTFLESSFKPCYKWNTFNTAPKNNWIPKLISGFKPCYKWNTFNTFNTEAKFRHKGFVLNLVISGIPSIPNKIIEVKDKDARVLNLVISGIPSIQ